MARPKLKDARPPWRVTTKAVGTLLIIGAAVVVVPGLALLGTGLWIEVRLFFGVEKAVTCPDWQPCGHRVVGIMGLMLCSGAASLMKAGLARFRI
jgi:hypothetical protein